MGVGPIFQNVQEDAAQSLLSKAERQVAQGHFSEARRTYQRIAMDHPRTAAGRVAERRSRPSAFLGWSDIRRQGPSANRVDIVLMGDGYELDDMKGFVRFADDIPSYFLQQRTLGEYDSYFNFLRADLVSADTGIDGFGRTYDTALDGKLTETFSQGRPVGTSVSVDVTRVRAMLTEIPEHDGLAIAFVKGASGGSAGSRLACLGGLEERQLIHLFGHAFADLADESEVLSHLPGAMSESANVSPSKELERLPWRHWLEQEVPGIGRYQGGAGFERGVWRPTSGNCVMHGSAGAHFYCLVCQEAVVLRIYSLVDPIDSSSSEPPLREFATALEVGEGTAAFEVRVLQPRTHDLEVRWWLLPAPPLNGSPAAAARSPGFHDRRDRGPLAPIAEKPTATTSGNRQGVHVFRLQSSSLGEGTFLLVCRVRDTTRLPRERWPLVLADEFGLLESERTWRVRR